MMRLFQFTIILTSLYLPVIIEAASLTVSIKSTAGDKVENAVITLSGKQKNTITNKHNRTYIVDQIDKTFVPHVKVIPVGSQVNFPNKDNIRHHVYSFSESKKFELPLYKGTPAKPVTFGRPGVVVLGCNIHDWMRGYVYVSDTPYFAKTDKSGNASIQNLPSGEFTLTIWHPQIIKNDIVKPSKVVFTRNEHKVINESINLKPLIKIRRSPAFRRRDY